MRSGGINWMAVIASAVGIYVLGFVIYGLLLPDIAALGMTDAQQATAISRMAFGPLMPIMIALFTALIFKWGAVGDMMSGIKWGAAIALASAIPTLLYAWLYGGGDTSALTVDAAHLLLGHVVAGAVIGGWR